MADEVGGGVHGTPFAVVPEWVLYSGTSDRAVRLYAVLQRHVNRSSGVARVGRPRLAQLLACSLDTLDRAMRELEDVDAVVVQRQQSVAGDPDVNAYTLRTDSPEVAARLRLPSRTVAATGSRNVAAQTRETLNEDQVVASASPTLQPGRGAAVNEPNAYPLTAAVEVQATLDGMPPPTPLPRGPAPRDVLWDTLEEHFGKCTNSASRGRRNQALRAMRQSLAAAGTAPDQQAHQLGMRLDRARMLWARRGLSYTEMAIATNWDVLGRLGDAVATMDAQAVWDMAVAQGLQT